MTNNSNTENTATIDLPRSKHLREKTHARHEVLDNSIMAQHAFSDKEGYAKFTKMQYMFHTDIDAIYNNLALQEIINGLLERRRLDKIKLDLADINVDLPAYGDAPVFSFQKEIDIPTALGWLYVSEGSNLGAAVLRKEAAKIGLSDTFGARQLAPATEGPAAYWRAFTSQLDAIEFSDDEEKRCIDGANDAFAHVQMLANKAFA